MNDHYLVEIERDPPVTIDEACALLDGMKVDRQYGPITIVAGSVVVRGKASRKTVERLRQLPDVTFYGVTFYGDARIAPA